MLLSLCAREAGGHLVAEQRAADALDLIGADAHADAGRAQDDAALTLAGCNGARRGGGVVGVVAARLVGAAEVLVGDAAFVEMFFERFLQIKSAMVTAKSDHKLLPPKFIGSDP